jgi:hypothetical protein
VTLARYASDAPTTAELADALDVSPERLEVFVDRREDPDAVAVLGTFVADPALEDDVAAWLAAREGGET